jgi:hypothetical protein
MRALMHDRENMAVRTFLMVYGSPAVYNITDMKTHMERSGFGFTHPDWVDERSGHMTKGDAQDWLRHLFSLESLYVEIEI